MHYTNSSDFKNHSNTELDTFCVCVFTHACILKSKCNFAMVQKNNPKPFAKL